MKIFPAIDVKNGKCVRLYQGEFSSSEVVGEDPLQTALSFVEQGAEYIHMVDLDGALSGTIGNANSINRVIKNINIPIQLGGGIRSLDAIEILLEKGLNRVILGTAALNNPSLVKEAVKKFGDKIAIGIDARDGYVAVEGWKTSSKIEYIDFAKQMENIGVKTIIFTDISRDGTLTGPNLEATGKINEEVSCNIIASGGMKGIEDIKKLAKMNMYGAIIGKALYSGNIYLAEAITEGRGIPHAY
ncbi:1-(5-phosphoribosyl)-5-[(5-phosphoribosylamino)methylideneamino]imidazole-4-carboxamide isomerase [Clostridium tagluense]|uniref:1-(5-phosphoribosyl)-5-[(5- phosphoribosylamino)methylideneamino]imidazole-4- carboxamide isomerase n=1 Tax=Clostridium TaxID=1485 RepID=UPI0013E95A36|nr:MULTISPECIES: 1-(5-phosphoribosyl)-5-[(5-phosphoribosylamino)methylideneamino]imidazole-4-carboxamide isomerase [Clostridium]MBW9159062.1 1-(5-phosphoribosyl)-5-[(5-phosphoribosylamino)methylideneamino]imidazole-4-carboxamide isomerase [Clostridium tagluense]MBZ9623532.1 1-(5-phosphoribosyl)-5-[(5-phosphoribosylamino)methylideneamino]imidazole-4-carboxamide isomerase [Clostridium sp. FP2]MCB2313852.1 1-(5-phosphoribosyl)-5-[(5-phosphoribosylamino)methylideneamino]imidazole-4-carboxamide isome